MTIYDYLTQDHDEVKALMNEIESLGDEESQRRTELFNQMKKSLILHAKSEEKAFYHPLREFKATRGEVMHAEEEHEEAEQLMKELTDGSLSGAAWMQKFRKLKAAVEHHIAEEEGEIFSDAQDVLDRDTEVRMEAEMKKLKTQERHNRTIAERQAAA